MRVQMKLWVRMRMLAGLKYYIAIVLKQIANDTSKANCVIVIFSPRPSAIELEPWLEVKLWAAFVVRIKYIWKLV